MSFCQHSNANRRHCAAVSFTVLSQNGMGPGQPGLRGTGLKDAGNQTENFNSRKKVPLGEISELWVNIKTNVDLLILSFNGLLIYNLVMYILVGVLH